ncbi:MAG: fibronectin type III domain-containing protein [Armatimonadetes bacterium]|nr:fibronectin type III domain-containing protein [Armatimonadota bacterium]
MTQPELLPIARVVPGHAQVTVEWQPPPGVQAARYELSVRLRTADPRDAATVTAPGTARSATANGLLDHADYALRVAARDTAGAVLAESGERLVSPAAVPGVVIDYLHKDDLHYAAHGRYIGSPSITFLPDGSLVASHDLFGPGPQSFTRVFGSPDGGATWTHLSDLEPAFWGKLFVHRGRLYLLACRTEYSDLLLHWSDDGGRTWERPAVVAEGPYHKAPVPVVEHDGRLWTGVELQTGTWPAGFQAVVASVPVEADLRDPAAWRLSAPLPYDPAWLPAGFTTVREQQGYLEGNLVLDPAGRLLNVLRYNTLPHEGRAVALRVEDGGRRLAFDRVLPFPGGMSKFTIRHHAPTGLYWSLVSRVTRPDQPGMRSVLTLTSSPDLWHWTPRRDILRDATDYAPRYVGYQYVDWEFDGKDIVAACRTAFNGARNFHDANHLTFHRIERFAEGGMVGP